jgi:hypothetical protein
MDKPEFWYPPPPTVEISVQKGTAKETVPAPEGSDEWIEYHTVLKNIESKKDEQSRSFCYSYGVVDWMKGSGTKWSKTPPKGWEPDAVLIEMLGIGEMPVRTAFIMYELLSTVEDLTAVDGVILRVEQEPLRGGEVQAAEDSFQGDVEE